MAAVLRQCIAASRLGFGRGLGLAATRKWRGFSGVLYSSEASQSLLKCVREDLKLEQQALVKLPSVTGYETTVTGSQALLQCIKGNDKVKVELDANNAVEVASDEEASYEDSEAFFAPAFTVTVTKPSGDQIQLECSFEEYGDYHPQGNEYQSMCLDSVTVIPANTQELETIYPALSSSFSEELYESLMDYLKDYGINERFASDILKFYKIFQQACYVEKFLKGLERVVQN